MLLESLSDMTTRVEILHKKKRSCLASFAGTLLAIMFIAIVIVGLICLTVMIPLEKPL